MTILMCGFEVSVTFREYERACWSTGYSVGKEFEYRAETVT